MFKYGQNFYLVLTEEAKERILNVSVNICIKICNKQEFRSGEEMVDNCYLFINIFSKRFPFLFFTCF